MAEAKLITLTVDGKPVTVPDGTTVLQACEQAGSPVPFYCYHPGLSIAGNCRICLVEIVGTPKLQISCYTPAAQGMVVNTTGEKTLNARRDVLEFLLINHPLDCPVCDQAGECWLQDYYMQHGLYDPKFNEAKNKKPKAVPVGPTVMLDAERCILCSRCVRFTDEVSKTGEFGIFNRGDRSEIGLHPGKTLDNNYSGNVVDICPVGALTDRDFRFKCRVWYLGAAKSVCPGCSRGCNIEIHYNREREARPHIADGARIMRLKPRHNPAVNQWWMCDVGRYSYKSVDQSRITAVQIREHGAAREGQWAEAIDRIGEGLLALKRANRLSQAGVILSSFQTNEELYTAKRVFGALGITQIVFQRPGAGAADGLLLQADRSPNARGAQALGIAEGAASLLEKASKQQLKALLVFGQDLTALFGVERTRQAAASLELLAWCGTNANPTAEMAHLVLPSAAYAEKDGTFTNFAGRVQRLYAAMIPLGDAKPDHEIVNAIGLRLGQDVRYAEASRVFSELATQEPAFAGLSYQAIGDQGVPLPGITG